MRSLKALVIILGVFIVVGMGVLAWGIAVKLGEVAEPDAAATEVTAWAAPLDVAIPPGAVVIETRAENDRLFVTLRFTDASHRILVFDLKTGKQIGTILLNRSEGAR